MHMHSSSLQLKYPPPVRTSDPGPQRDGKAPTIVVHDNYGTYVPPHPGQGWTRFVCISDTHSKVFPLPAGDVLVHAGDLCSWGTVGQLKVTMDWLVSLPHPTKIIIAGNHDLCLDETRVNAEGFQYSNVTQADVVQARSFVKSRAAAAAGLHYLEHESMELKTGNKTWKIYGSPAAPRFMPGSFQYEDSAEAEAIYRRIPRDTEVLLTHTPAYGVLDMTRRGKHVGCPTLSATLEELKQCRMHVFGHIHEGHGAVVHQAGKRVSVNAAMAGHHGQAIIVDLRE
ncbi:Metallo-dependent phosphatase [Russula earlei]|uniref:Metallo-dependent phosphatase n=1 Tax=Russula earlei TaxID=71964 RepID=A0ACC0UEM7_9AGAM|nr:Metallo-dependent phosphatase [Russula earlei]